MTWKVATGKKGQRSPPPLPMYERVVLKHVPTMVRRRYDKNLNIIDENQENNEDNDGVEGDFDDGFEDSEGEDDTLSSLDYDHDDSQSCMDNNFASNNVESSSSSKYSNDNTSEDDEAQDRCRASSEDATRVDDKVMDQANAAAGSNMLLITCSNDCEKEDGDYDVDRVDGSVEKEAHENEHDCVSKGKGVEDANVSVQGGEIQDIEHKNLDDEQDDNESEGDGSENNQSQASEYRDGSVKDEVQGNQHVNLLENQQGSCIESCKDDENDGIRDVNGSSHYAEINNPNHEAKDEEQGNSYENVEAKEYHSPAPLPMYERVLLKHVPTIVRRRYDKDIKKSDALSGLSEEDGKSKGDGADEDGLHSTTSSDVDDNSCDDEACTKATLDIIEHDTQTNATEGFQHNSNFESSMSIYSEEINKEDATKHSSNVSSVDAGVEDKLQVQEHAKLELNVQGSYLEDVEEDIGARDKVSLTSDVDARVKIEPEMSEQGSCLKDRDVQVEEDDGAKDVNLASDVDASVKHEVNDEQGLQHSEDCKAEDDGAKDVDVEEEVLDKDLGKHEKFDNKQDLIPEVFMKTLERDGYDLYCPNCKHSITHNMIFRRRVDDDQQCKTTCFSFLISLFCCNRMN